MSQVNGTTGLVDYKELETNILIIYTGPLMGRDGNKATGSESGRYHLPTEREEKKRKKL